MKGSCTAKDLVVNTHKESWVQGLTKSNLAGKVQGSQCSMTDRADCCETFASK